MAFFRKKSSELDMTNIPAHIAIIMDGNGRWARKRGLPHSAGHQAGAKTLKTICLHARDLGVKYITVYAFSTENWKRDEKEVSGIMDLLLYYLRNAERELGATKAQIRVIGDRSRFSDEIQKEMDRVENLTKPNTDYVINLCLNYGGRAEIVNALKSICKDGINADNIDEELVSSRLYTSQSPDPDLVIRTSGEERISNFLLWQSAYSEYYFTDTLWPDFSNNDLDKAIISYQKRNRRFGGR